MPEIICFEVTNRCNLDCLHCNKIINTRPVKDISIELVDRVLTEAKPFNPRVVALTGGEPTVHKDFERLLATVERHDIDYTITTNGQNFRDTHKALIRHASRLTGITLSLEGASARTNDKVRGAGSFDRVLEAMDLCRRHGIGFGVQTVVSTVNINELEAIVALVAAQGADPINFILMRPSPRNIQEGLLLDLEAAELVEQRVGQLKVVTTGIRVDMTLGYYSPWPLFACRPLGLAMIDVDYNGCLRFCPDLSNYRGAGSAEDDNDVVADLNEVSLQKALKAMAQRVAVFWQNKIDHTAAEDLGPTDHFPCYYCLRYFNKADCLDL
ncbi:radical SAM protein [bacterium]|nr:radical SAM protein [bacterium]